nr:DUF1573 domain-containing protein [uncultured Bacteroides sp.]
MKQLFVSICYFLCCVITYAQEPSKVFVSNERIHDFGQILEKNGKVSHTFNFYNKGNKPVVINDVSAWCGCTTSSYTKKPVLPGKKATVTVTYNPYNRPGSFSKEVVVLTESGKSYSRLWIKGYVIPYLHPVEENYPYKYGGGLWMNMEVMAFGTLDKGSTKTMKLKLANDTNANIKLFFVVVGGNTDVKFTSPRALKAHEERVIPITYQCSESFSGIKKTRIYLVVNNKVLVKPLVVTCIGKE